jgi:hypothetical protein
MSGDTTTIAAGFESARLQITGAIKQAASATGASFEYLLSAAKIESNFNPTAGASTSSARGLYQFIEQTWLGTVKEAGTALGYGKYADSITKSASGTYSVSDPSTRDDILKLRDDPAVNAAMAGVLTQSNSFKLTSEIGRRPTDGELYIAHFMGVGGAAKLINAAAENPQASAARLFPSAAAANVPIFYDRGGNQRSVSEVYSVLTSRYNSAANSQATRTAMATEGANSPVDAVSPTTSAVPQQANNFFLAGFPAASNGATAVPSAARQSDPVPKPTFRSLYQVGARPEPVSPVVQELWGNGSSLSSNAATGAAAQSQPLDLFSDRAGIFSGSPSGSAS